MSLKCTHVFADVFALQVFLFLLKFVDTLYSKSPHFNLKQKNQISLKSLSGEVQSSNYLDPQNLKPIYFQMTPCSLVPWLNTSLGNKTN